MDGRRIDYVHVITTDSVCRANAILGKEKRDGDARGMGVHRTETERKAPKEEPEERRN
jgi:hypothetical protein